VSGPPVPFNDLHPGEDAADVQAAIQRVIRSGWFVLGPEVEAFEHEFAAASGAAHAVAVGNGTDAIALLLRALAIGPGDEVIVPAITAAYTALAVTSTGAAPVIVDLSDDTLTLDPVACEAAVTSRTRAIIPVHLYGQAAAMTAISAIAARHGLAIVEDCCQAHLATSTGVPVGTIGAGGAFSFYPTKNLGAMGDGGAVVTGDAQLARRLRLLRNGGQSDRYHHDIIGVNSRLDEMQAAILRARLPRLRAATAQRRELATRYRARLTGAVVPVAQRDPGHVYHPFPVRVATGERGTSRNSLQAHLRARGFETLVHYPVALNDQPAFAPYRRSACPVAAAAAQELLSLPLHPRIRPDQVDEITAVIADWRS